MRNTKYTLNESECNVATNHGLSRYFNNREKGTNNQSHKVGNHPIFKEVDGVGGEIAVAKFFNVFPDIDPTPRSGGCDLVTKTGVRVEVKTTDYAKGRLIAQKWKEEQKCSDIYVLVIGTLPTFKIIGWIASEDLLLDENVKTELSGECYSVTQDKLKPMTDIPVVKK